MFATALLGLPYIVPKSPDSKEIFFERNGLVLYSHSTAFSQLAIPYGLALELRWAKTFSTFLEKKS